MKNKIYLFKFLIIKIKKNYLNNKILIFFNQNNFLKIYF